MEGPYQVKETIMLFLFMAESLKRHYSGNRFTMHMGADGNGFIQINETVLNFNSFGELVSIFSTAFPREHVIKQREGQAGEPPHLDPGIWDE